jgi:hypothetical protein
VTRQAIKFDSAFAGKIQRRAKTQTRRPVRHSKLSDGRRVVRPCAFRHLETYQFVTVEDRPFEWDALTTAEKLVYAKRGVTPGSTVYKTVETVAEGEFLRVLHEPRREALIDISDEDIEAEGFEEREEYIEYMAALYGEHVETVWVIEFEWTLDGTLFLARQAGSVHPEQYTPSAGLAIDDTPVVDIATLERFSREAHERDGLRMELKREERKLSEWLAELESDPTTSAHQLASVRKRLEQIEKRRRRRAA